MIISLVGCNAIGKTTAARRWAAKYPQLVSVSADGGTFVIRDGVEKRQVEWKGEVATKERLTRGYAAEKGVVLIESARTTHLAFTPEDSPTIVVTCSWQLYEKHMRARCLAKGKRFRDDYWTQDKLAYECSRRYLSWVAKHFEGREVHYFEIEDQARDWPKVDECFDRLYRRMAMPARHVIQIRGTSGSGKSWAMRQVMEALGDKWLPVFREGRKQPLYYELVDGDRPTVVLGHYNSACGGCDTIGSAAAVYELIASLPEADIVCEGLLLSEDVKWSSQLDGLQVLYLTTPLETCLDQIRARRAEAGNDKELNIENTANRVDVIARSRLKLNELGVPCSRLSAAQVADAVIL